MITITLHLGDDTSWPHVQMPQVPKANEVISYGEISFRIREVQWKFDKGQFVAVHVYARRLNT